MISGLHSVPLSLKTILDAVYHFTDEKTESQRGHATCKDHRRLTVLCLSLFFFS